MLSDYVTCVPGMLTRPTWHEAKPEAEAKMHEAEAEAEAEARYSRNINTL